MKKLLSWTTLNLRTFTCEKMPVGEIRQVG